MNTEESKTDIISQQEAAKVEQEMLDLDVCFLLDATGSMQRYIDLARDKISDIISQLKSQYSESSIRISIVAYRDHMEKTQYEVFAFNNSVDAAKGFLASLKAFGGRDVPEDVNGGFQKALALQWKKYTTKMIYHLADAPCHGKKFFSGIDNYPNGHKNDKPWEELLKQAYDMDINYLFFDIGANCKLMYDKFFRMFYESGDFKEHLIFSYEVMAAPIKKPEKHYGIAKVSGIKMLSSVCKIEEKEEKDEDLEKMFVKATVCNAERQRIKNKAYQMRRFNIEDK